MCICDTCTTSSCSRCVSINIYISMIYFHDYVHVCIWYVDSNIHVIVSRPPPFSSSLHPFPFILPPLCFPLTSLFFPPLPLLQLLHPDESKRLQTVESMRQHRFFQDTDWDQVEKKETTPVYVPAVRYTAAKSFILTCNRVCN